MENIIEVTEKDTLWKDSESGNEDDDVNHSFKDEPDKSPNTEYETEQNSSRSNDISTPPKCPRTSLLREYLLPELSETLKMISKTYKIDKIAPKIIHRMYGR